MRVLAILVALFLAGCADSEPPTDDVEVGPDLQPVSSVPEPVFFEASGSAHEGVDESFSWDVADNWTHFEVRLSLTGPAGTTYSMVDYQASVQGPDYSESMSGTTVINGDNCLCTNEGEAGAWSLELQAAPGSTAQYDILVEVHYE